MFFRYIKISKDLSDKYYHDNKEKIQKKLVKDIKTFLQKKKKKNDNMALNDTKIYKSLFNVEKNVTK